MKIALTAMRFLKFLVLLLLLSQCSLAKQPKRVMILVFDQMRAEYIDRFELENFQRAQTMGLNFDNGIVGHLESNTIISHPVITTGKLPRNMAWSAQIMKDTQGNLGQAGQFYQPAGLSAFQWHYLHLVTSGPSSLLARLARQNSGPTFAVAQKEYAAYNFGGPFAESIIALGSALKEGDFKGHHRIAGQNIPDYIAEPLGNRFYLEATNKWGSEVERYSMKGSGYITGSDPDRPGGDAWVGDVVEQIMLREHDWAAILASFGAIDKVGHVLAEQDGPSNSAWAKALGISMEDTLHKADRELGRILDRLESQGLMDETVLVITADHGGQRNSQFHGRSTPGRHTHDQNYGKGGNFDFTSDPNPHWMPLIESGDIEAITMDTLGLFWVKDEALGKLPKLAKIVKKMPGMAEVYAKNPRGNYELLHRSPKLKGKQLRWARLQHQSLVDTLGGDAGPHLVGVLFDNHGYSMIGAHGGAQEFCQRIPMIVLSPNLVKKGVSCKEYTRLVDINPIVGRLLGLPEHSQVDGTWKAIEPFLK